MYHFRTGLRSPRSERASLNVRLLTNFLANPVHHYIYDDRDFCVHFGRNTPYVNGYKLVSMSEVKRRRNHIPHGDGSHCEFYVVVRYEYQSKDEYDNYTVYQEIADVFFDRWMSVGVDALKRLCECEGLESNKRKVLNEFLSVSREFTSDQVCVAT